MEEQLAMDDTQEIAEVYTVNNLETLKVMADPMRIQICELLLPQPLTVKQMAAELDTPATKLYYHINLLEEHGLIKVVSTRIVSGIIEKHYRTSAMRVEVEPSLFSQNTGEGGDTGLSTAIESVLDSTKNDLKRSIRTGLINLANVDRDKRTVYVVRNLSRLSREQAHEFWKRLDGLCKEFDAAPSSDPDDNVYGLTLAFYPTHQHRPDQAVDKKDTSND